MSLSTTGLTLLSLTSTSLLHPMKRRVIGLALLTTKVTLSPGESLLRTLKRSSLDLVLEVPSGPQQTSVLHHLQGRGPHFLFLFPILNNLNFLCALDPLDESNPTFEHFVNSQSGEDEDNPIPMTNIDIPISLADLSFYHLRTMGSATWPKLLTLMTMDNLLKTSNSS